MIEKLFFFFVEKQVRIEYHKRRGLGREEGCIK